MLALRLPRWPREAIERMKTPGSSVWRPILILSPSTAPPESGLEGSTAATATVRPLLRNSATKASISVDFPAPGGPVNPTVRAAPVEGSSARCRLPAEGPPASMIVMARATALGSPARSRCMKASMASAVIRSGDDQRMSEAELTAQAADHLAVGDADVNGLHHLLEGVLVRAVGGAGQ